MHKMLPRTSRRRCAKSEEVNQLQLDIAGNPPNIEEQQVKLSALSPELDEAKVELKKLEDKVVAIRNAAEDAKRKAESDEKEAKEEADKLKMAQDQKEQAKLKLEKEIQEAKAQARKEEDALKKEMQAKLVKESKKIRKHGRAKAKDVAKTKWFEMRRTLKLKTVICDASNETELAKVKRKLKLTKNTLKKIQKSHSEQRAKIKRKTLQEKRAK